MDVPFVLLTMARRGLLNPGRPDRIVRQLDELRRWGFGLAGEVRQAAARSPDSVALIDDVVGTVTYGRLDAQVRRLARALPAVTGVRPGDRVGLLCRNHSGLVTAMIASVSMGADPVLVNTGLSAAQVSGVAAEQRLRVLIYDAEFAEVTAGVPRDVHRVLADATPRRGGNPGHRRTPGPASLPVGATTTLAGLIEQAPPGEPRPPEQPGRLIVLTSGTTGAPKGARRPNPAGFGPLAAILSRIPWQVGDRMLISAPVFHTWGLSALQLALALRGTVVLQRRFEPATALRALAEYRCGSLVVVPVMLQRLLDVPRQARPAVPDLRIVAVSGSSLPGGLATRFMDEFGDVIYNLYGSTEVSWVSIATPSELREDPGCAGRPPRGTRLVILDRRGRPVHAGAVGQIHVANEMLFDGYTSGHRHEPVDGLLPTGDLGHFSRTGLLHVDGRVDDMVISGGENVYPSEVENLLAGLPQVREVAVAGIPDAEYGQRLAAFVVLRPGERLDAEAVREYVRRHLARFAVPREIHFLNVLPRNATGKVVVGRLLALRRRAGGQP
jgi:acyl-CoA synthetase (AMP-forming)/AMP-acid ligase II